MISETGSNPTKTFEVKCSLIDLKTNSCVESVTTSGSSHIKAKKAAAEIAIKSTKLKVPSKEQLNNQKNEKVKQNKTELAYEEYEYTNKFFIKNHLLVKHKQIQPSRDQLDLISHLVTNIEKALKKISDKLVDEELKKLPATEATADLTNKDG